MTFGSLLIHPARFALVALAWRMALSALVAGASLPTPPAPEPRDGA